jgi:hypothetical protein
LRANSEIFVVAPSDGCPATANLLSLDASLAISTRVLRFKVSVRRCTPVSPVLLTGQTGTHRLDRSDSPFIPRNLVILASFFDNSIFGSSVLALWINKGTQWFSGEPLESPRTRCSLRQSPLMTRLPRSSGSTLVLRLNQETIHDFSLPFLPPCGPHLTPLATGSLERNLLVFSTPGGLTGNDLSRLFFTCTNTCKATCTCNT